MGNHEAEMSATIDKISSPEIMTPEEVAEFLKVSVKSVYKHQKELGGKKLGGSLRFPSKEDLYERLFRQGKEALEVRIQRPERALHSAELQHKKGGSAGGGAKKGGAKKSATGGIGGDAPNKYGLLDAMQSKAGSSMDGRKKGTQAGAFWVQNGSDSSTFDGVCRTNALFHYDDNLLILLVPGAGIEPARTEGSRDFKSLSLYNKLGWLQLIARVLLVTT